MGKFNNILVEQDGEILKVILNRPKVLNAMNIPMVEELLDLFSTIRHDRGIRFLVFTGAGRAFTSGADMKETDAAREQGYAAFLEGRKVKQKLGHVFMKSLENLEQVTIVAANGMVVGAGIALALGCDFRIASDQALFSIPEAGIGIFFTWGSTARLVKLVGPSNAKELIMTCDQIDAEEAFRIGFVNKVVPHERLMEEVYGFIGKIARRSDIAVRQTKLIANAVSTPLIGDISNYEPELVELCYLNEDADEAVNAFKEKREPRFTGKTRIVED
jgi:enoyl-CoA hydratase/carnithine racemase